MSNDRRMEPKITVEDKTNERDGTEGEWVESHPWDADIELTQIGGKVEVEVTISTCGSSDADARARLSAGVEEVCAALMLAVKQPSALAMLTALQEIEPLLKSAQAAYRFSPTAYTYDAMLACMKARGLARDAINKWQTAATDGAHSGAVRTR